MLNKSVECFCIIEISKAPFFKENSMTYFTCFFLDNEKDIIVSLYKDLDKMFYVLTTPNHGTGNLIRNLAKTCNLPLSQDENEMLEIGRAHV